MFCIKCGKENREGAIICYYCGALLTKQKLGETGENTKAATPPAPTPPPPPAETPAPPPIPPINPWVGNTYGQNFPPQYGSPSSLPPNFGRGGLPTRFPSSPAGVPYIVMENPHAFYSYTNKEEKQAYAVYAPFGIRALGAIIDTLLMSIPFFFISALVYYILLSNIQDLPTNLDTNNPEVIQASNWFVFFSGTFYLIYCVVLTALRGQTVGHRILGIKVMRLNGTKPDFQTALVRNLFGYSWILARMLLVVDSDLINLIAVVLTLMVLFGFSSAAYQEKRQGWHDRLAGTLVVFRNELVKDKNF
jgi:uncharacterized RDD family membrane protein YckC